MPAINPLSARYVAICTAAITDGGFFASNDCVAIAVLADGSEIPDPSTANFGTQAGNLGVEASFEHTYRITEFLKGDQDAIKAIRNQVGTVCAIINRGASNYTNYGPGIISHVSPIGNNLESQPGGAKLMFSAEEDFAEEIINVLDQAATISA